MGGIFGVASKADCSLDLTIIHILVHVVVDSQFILTRESFPELSTIFRTHRSEQSLKKTLKNFMVI